MLIFAVFLVPFLMMVFGLGAVFATFSIPFKEKGCRKLLCIPMAVLAWALFSTGREFWMFLLTALPT